MSEQFLEALKRMEVVLHHFESLVPLPKKVPMLNHFVYRYTEKTIQQAIIQKLARVITGLKSAQLLLEHGYFQEQASVQRMLDEFQQDISFLSLGVPEDNFSDLHKKYLEAFYEEEFDIPEDPVASKQKRVMVPRRNIIAYLARTTAEVVEPTRGIKVIRTLSKAYSGYIHGASTQIMSLYGGLPPSFHVSGMLGTPHEHSHRADLWNYFYRGLMSFEEAAYVFGEIQLANDLRAFSESMAATHE